MGIRQLRRISWLTNRYGVLAVTVVPDGTGWSVKRIVVSVVFDDEYKRIGIVRAWLCSLHETKEGAEAVGRAAARQSQAVLMVEGKVVWQPPQPKQRGRPRRG